MEAFTPGSITLRFPLLWAHNAYPLYFGVSVINRDIGLCKMDLKCYLCSTSLLVSQVTHSNYGCGIGVLQV